MSRDYTDLYPDDSMIAVGNRLIKAAEKTTYKIPSTATVAMDEMLRCIETLPAKQKSGETFRSSNQLSAAFKVISALSATQLEKLLSREGNDKLRHTVARRLVSAANLPSKGINPLIPKA